MLSCLGVGVCVSERVSESADVRLYGTVCVSNDSFYLSVRWMCVVCVCIYVSFASV